MGGVRYHDRKRICFFLEKGNGESFYKQLERLNEAIKKKWILAGNPAAEFQELGPKLLIILDNASYHKTQEILEKSKKLRGAQIPIPAASGRGITEFALRDTLPLCS